MSPECKTIQTTILGGSVDQLKQLLTSNGSDTDLYSKLFCAYAEMKHRNIQLSDEVVYFVEYELVKASYHHATNAYQAFNANSSAKGTETKERITHMVQCIDLIVNQQRAESYTDIDEMLVLRLRHIYAHVFFLKTHLRMLPLLQLQFCIAVFLKLVTGKAVNGFDVYAFTIDKERLIRFLKLMRNAMINQKQPVIDIERYVQYVQHLYSPLTKMQLCKVPKRIRTYVQMQLRSLNPSAIECIQQNMSLKEFPPALQQTLQAQYDKAIDWDHRKRSRKMFRELHETYYIMKQHFSIRKVIAYIDGIREESSNDPPHKHRPVPSPTRIRAIKRTLQVIGEMIKSTRESPNITVKLDRILQLITSEALAERTKDLRQFFSHGYSLAKLELEAESSDQLGIVFQQIETNLREARRWFAYTQTQQNLLIYRRYLAYLKRFKTLEALRSYIAFVGTEFKGTLIEKYLPEQLTEAKLLLQYMLDPSKSPDLFDAATRTDLEYIVKELELRIDVIRSENAKLGRTIDDFFFLESYIRQPTASLERVRQIVNWILYRTEQPKRHKLVQKTDLKYARELLARLQMAETDETRRFMWSAIWTRLGKEQFGGLDTLLGRTEQRIDVALDATVKTMQALDLPLEDDEYVQFVNRRLAKSYYQNVFVLDNKYRVLKEIVKDRRARQINTRDMLEKLKVLRTTDEYELQRTFDALLDSMEHILNRANRSTGNLASRSDEQALEYCVLEAAEILCNLSLFRDNMTDLAALIPVITGRNLRNYLAHDFLAYETLTPCTKAVVMNARYLVESRLKLYVTAVVKKTTSKAQSEGFKETIHFSEIFQRQIEWTIDQIEFFNIVQTFRMHSLEQRILEEETNACLLLMQRTFLDREVLSIAIEGQPESFINHLLNYQPNNSNLFYLLINYLPDTQLIEKIKILIEDPYVFCSRLATKYGLIDVLRRIWKRSSEEVMKQLISTEMSCIFAQHTSYFVWQLLELIPVEWFNDLRDHLGNTVLHWAVLRSDLDLLQFALSRYNILLKTKNFFGDNPLLIAVRYHEDVVVEMLLDHGADPWIEPKVIQTVAMRNGLQLLKRFSTDIGRIVPGQMDGYISNPLRAAIEENNYDVFVMLHKQFKFDLQRGELLHLAARLNRVNFMQYMLTYVVEQPEERVLIDTISKAYCYTPFMLACATGQYEAARLLLQKGANGLYQNENNYNSWHCAVHGGKRAILQLLLAIPQLNVNLVTKDKRSALSIAIDNEQTPSQINFLLTTAGVTVLAEHVLHACLLGKKDILKVLIDRRPDYLSAHDFLQRSPLMIAVTLNDPSMTQYLLERGADHTTLNILGMNCLHVAALNNFIGISKLLLDNAQFDLEAEDNFHRTPLVVALETEHLTIAEQLIQRGASLKSAYDFRYKNHRNATLLHKFTIEKRPRIVEYLVKKLNFPTDLVDDDGKTADAFGEDSFNSAASDTNTG
uniref:ANK_REP_REGION domain-containing protein n=1 Tax=Anopheles epiroticus TaxID=199890 RepID=A0A182P8H3_9DIPT